MVGCGPEEFYCRIVFLLGWLFVFLHFFCVFCFLSTYYGCGYLVDFLVFSGGGLDIGFSFLFDWVSLGFFSFISLVSGVVFFYCFFYMGEDVLTKRFLLVLFLFVASMGILVFSGNIFTTMVGWDGLGLVSFVLVIYYQSISSVDSGLLTVYSNRLGDGFFLVSFSWYFLGGA